MPKKRAPAFTHNKPSYVHPSLERSAPPSSSASTGPQTVNERLQQLRREQAPRTTAQRRDDLTAMVTERTIPLHLRRILHMTEVDAPWPKSASRTRASPNPGRRPPPGPAAPPSWLDPELNVPERNPLPRSQWAKDSVTSNFCLLARLSDAEFRHLPSPRSLAHQCLRTFTIHWRSLVVSEQHYLREFPALLKEAFFSYLSRYGENGALDLASIKALFSHREGQGSDSEEIRILDLTGLLNPKYTLDELGESFPRPFHSTAPTPAPATQPLGRPQTAEAQVADSWEDEDVDTVSSGLPSTLSVPLFPHLTRLSLAHPGTAASWPKLITLSASLNKLTHLSLAYWPIPANHMHPFGETDSVLSGDFNGVDWEHAIRTLRRLSLNTYSLKWLDLEGCRWLKALTTTFPDLSVRSEEMGGGLVSSTLLGPDWDGAWSQIEYLHLYQGWIPNRNEVMVRMGFYLLSPIQHRNICLELLSRDGGDGDGHVSDSDLETIGWLVREEVARTVATRIRDIRKITGGKWCMVDHGWKRHDLLTLTPG